MYIPNPFSKTQIRWFANNVLDYVLYMVLVFIVFSPWDQKTFRILALIGLLAFILQKTLLILDRRNENRMLCDSSVDLKILRYIRLQLEKRLPVTDDMINLSKSISLKADIAYIEYFSDPHPFSSVAMKEL